MVLDEVKGAGVRVCCIQKWTQHATLGRGIADCEGEVEMGAKSHRLWSVREEILYQGTRGYGDGGAGTFFTVTFLVHSMI